jgi:hypothetical protein
MEKAINRQRVLLAHLEPAASPAAAAPVSRWLCRPLAQAAARQRKGRGRAAAAARVPPPESPDAGGDAGARGVRAPVGVVCLHGPF